MLPRNFGSSGDGVQHRPDQSVGLLNRPQVVIFHPVVIVADLVGPGNVQEAEGGRVGAQRVDQGLRRLVVVPLEGDAVDLRRAVVRADPVQRSVGVPAAHVELELELGRVQGGASPVVMDDIEDARHIAARRLVHRAAVVLVEGHAMPAGPAVDPTSGQQRGVVGQGLRGLDRGTRLEGCRALAHHPVQVRRTRGSEPVDRQRVQPVDGDRDHSADVLVVDVVGSLGRSRGRQVAGRGRGPARRRCARGPARWEARSVEGHPQQHNDQRQNQTTPEPEARTRLELIHGHRMERLPGCRGQRGRFPLTEPEIHRG